MKIRKVLVFGIFIALIVYASLITYNYFGMDSKLNGENQVGKQEKTDDDEIGKLHLEINNLNSVIDANDDAINKYILEIEKLNSVIVSKDTSYSNKVAENDELRIILSEKESALDLFSFDAFENGNLFETEDGFVYDIEIAQYEDPTINGYIDLYIQDKLFDEIVMYKVSEDTTMYRIFAFKSEYEDFSVNIEDVYVYWNSLIYRNVYAHNMAHDFCEALKNQNYRLLEAVVIEDDLFPSESVLKSIVDLYKEVVDLETLDIDLVGIDDVGYKYLLSGTKNDIGFSESIHVSIGDGIFYIVDYRGRYEWTGHLSPVMDDDGFRQ